MEALSLGFSVVFSLSRHDYLELKEQYPGMDKKITMELKVYK